MRDASAKVKQLRNDLPATQRTTYLNTGSCGPLPRVFHETLVREDEREVDEGRVTAEAWQGFARVQSTLRGQLADLLRCGAEDVSITRNTTDGLNMAIWGIDWNNGDELVTTNLEHIGGLAPLFSLAERRGVRLRVADCGPGGVDAISAIRSQLSSRTRAVMLSHVSYLTGYRLPVEELSRIVHQAGAALIVDGAQSAGAISLDMHVIGADAYAIPAQKWLCGPEGFGALYVSGNSGIGLKRSFASMVSYRKATDSDSFLPNEDARRFEMGTLYRPAQAGFSTTLDWLLNSVGIEWAAQRIAELAAYCAVRLARLPGVTVVTPTGQQAGLVSLALSSDAAGVSENLGAQGIIVRSVGHFLRVSTGFFNTEAEIDFLAESLGDVLNGSAIVRLNQPAGSRGRPKSAN